MVTLLMAAVIALRPLAGDNTAQVVEAASRLCDGDTIQFEKGEYHFHEKAGKDLFLASPGSETGMKKALIHLKGLKDVTVDGGGSHFVFHENVFPFVFENCERVKLRGFTSDVAQLSVAEFVCEEKTKEGFLCRFTSKDTTYSIDDRGVITFTFEGGSVSSEIQEISVHALKWCQIHYLCGPSCRRNKDTLASTFFTVRAEDRGEGRVFFRYFDEKHPKHIGEFPFRTGAPLAFLLGCARNRSLAAIRDCRGVTVENVHVRTGVGMGLVMDMCEDVRISRYRVRPEDGRFVSLTADTMYLVDCKGQIEIDGCEISWAMDDALNIHGNYTQLKAVDGRRIRVRHPHRAYNGYFPYRDGERLEFSCGYGSKRKILGMATIAAFRTPADREAREFEIELDRTVPSDWLGCDVANLSHAPKIRIHDNHFHDFMHIRLSAFADVVFENNRIENGNSVMMVDDLKGYWGECGPVHDLTVRNNEIVSLRHHCFDIHVPITGRAVFENNRLPEGFRDRPFTFGPAVSAEDRRKFSVLGGGAVSRPVPSEVPLVRIGTLRPRQAPDPKDDQWMIGCEVLDRDFAKFSAYRDYLPQFGIRSIRLQGGWAKCEREKGKYDFAWLDEPVDFALAHGLNPVLETDYGNPLYKGGGGRDLAAGFPYGDEGLAAWDRWVDALSRHFAGRVRDWAMWNEPDIGNPADTDAVGGHHTPEAIAAFNVRTAKIIRRNIPDARIAGLSLATNDPKFNEACYKAFGSDIGLFWRFIYHGYVPAPEASYANVMALKDLCARYAPHATLWQGENGAPSEMPGDGLALNHIAWSEVTQAKWDLRRMLGDFVHGVPSSVFTICDYFHPGRGIGSYGLLRADANRDVIGVKQAFSAVRNVATVFDSELVRVPRRVSSPERTLWLYEYARRGYPLFVFWMCGGYEETPGGWKMVYRRPSDGNATRPAVIEHPDAPMKEPVWVDLRTGAVHEVPRANVLRRAGGTTYVGMPVYDSPCLLTERTAIDMERL